MNDELCGKCHGNGVLKLKNGVAVCDACGGKCWAPKLWNRVENVAAETNHEWALLKTVIEILKDGKPGAAWNAVHEEEAELVAMLEDFAAFRATAPAEGISVEPRLGTL